MATAQDFAIGPGLLQVIPGKYPSLYDTVCLVSGGRIPGGSHDR